MSSRITSKTTLTERRTSSPSRSAAAPDLDDRHQLPLPHKSPHDFYVDLYGSSAPQHARKHRNALFCKSVSQIF
jgi:hypothetical protein